MSYIPRFTISEKIKANLQEIARLRGIVGQSRILPEAEASIRQRASVEAVHSSTSIEGNPLSLGQVQAVVASGERLSRMQYAEIEVQNYKQALDFIAERRGEDEPVTINDVLILHKIITRGLLDHVRMGKWRKNPVYIEGEGGKVFYTGAEARKLEKYMKELVEYVAENQFVLHPVILAGILHYQILSIHPFADGNGRTARAVTALFLALMQYDNEGSLVLDSYYATDKARYYQVLREVSGRDYASAQKADLTAWLEYFTEGFVTSLHVLDAEIRIMELALTGAGEDELTQEEVDIMEYVTKYGEIRIAEAEKLFPGMGRRTLQRKLSRLVERGQLVLVGATHDARYVAKSKSVI